MSLPWAVDENQPSARWKTKTPALGLTRSTIVWQGAIKISFDDPRAAEL
jgi:hypothetical protein